MRFRPSHGVLPAAALGLCVVALASCQSKKKAACTSSSQCPAGDACSGGACVQPVMPQCGSQKVCQQDSTCPSQQCATDGCCYGVCTTDSDCTSTQNCVLGVCRDIGAQCTINADCPYMAAPICDTSVGACVQCLMTTGPQNNECPAGEYCTDDGCSAPANGGCTQNSDCTVPQLPVCDSADQCVACLVDTDCPSGDTCNGNVCTGHPTSCQFDGDCVGNANGAYCAANGQCVACLVNTNCPPNSLCLPTLTCSSASTCATDADCSGSTPYCSPADHFCFECVENDQCPTGQVCKSGYCEPPVNGCLTSADCMAPLGTCDTADRTCIGCLTDSDCPAFCESQTCEPCSTDSDCLSNAGTLEAGRLLCSGGACVQCIGTPNCSDGLVCSSSGMCVTNPVNQPCPASGVCAGGLDCIADGTATGTCRQPCDPYSTTCGNGLVCGIVGGETSGDPSGACQPSIPGSSAIGQSCSSTQPCDRDGVCLPNGTSSEECYPRCDPNESSAACGSPNMCASIVGLDPNDVPFTEGVCIPQGTFTESCSSNGSCSSGQLCIAEGDPQDPVTLENECWYPYPTSPAGSGGAGAGCSHDTDCQSGQCIIGMPQNQQFPGFCDGACTSSASCPILRSDSYPGGCGDFPVPWYNASGTPDTVPVTTCFTQCRGDDECPTGTTCDIVADVSGAAWLSRCVPTSSTGTGLGGAVCYQDSDCFSNDCLPLTEAAIGTDGSPTRGGICSGVCNPANGTLTNPDCASGATCPASGQSLDIGTGNNYYPAPICWTESCTTNEQCGPAGTCTGFPAADNSADITLGCIPTQGTTEGGGACTLDSDCQSGWCVTWGGGVDLCFGACQAATAASNCASGSTCYTGNWTQTTPNSIVSYCGPSQ